MNWLTGKKKSRMFKCIDCKQLTMMSAGRQRSVICQHCKGSAVQYDPEHKKKS